MAVRSVSVYTHGGVQCECGHTHDCVQCECGHTHDGVNCECGHTHYVGSVSVDTLKRCAV
jgi:hypothetical protein